MTERAVLHSEINCCYAQIECQARPELRGRPVVGGDEEARHGIVLGGGEVRGLYSRVDGVMYLKEDAERL